MYFDNSTSVLSFRNLNCLWNYRFECTYSNVYCFVL